MIRRTALTLFAMALLAAGGCDSGGETDSNLPDVPAPIDPADFVETVDNRYWPLAPGTTFDYAWASTDGAEMTEEIEVLVERRTVNGVQATVVWDRVYRESALYRETWSWYAQDEDGNVWAMGRESYDIVDFSRRLSPASWESGVNGARAGLFMPFEPALGDYYYKGYLKGKAQDIGEVVSLGEDVQVPAGVFKECVQIRDTTPLDLDVLRNRFFCPNVGLVLTVDVADGNLREELVAWGGL